MKLTTIGTGTAEPHPMRVASSHLVEAGDVRLLMDCGSGSVHRMAALGVRWQNITHVVITHFHADHVADLVMLVMAWRWGQLPPRETPLTLYGPVGTGALMEKLAVLYGPWMLAPGFPLTIRDLVPDEVVTLPGHVRFSAHPVPHTAESVAYSIEHGGRRLVYTGDTGFDEAVGTWAADCDLLLAECSLPDALAIGEHLTPRQAGALAGIARARRLVLTHFYSPVEAVDIAGQVSEHYSGPLVLATDGWSSEV
ncbi:MAG TPA: ribonuclease Z [Gemmatimonas sp.]|nr:ribonuclease Z [Gemmatimonas sp.]